MNIELDEVVAMNISDETLEQAAGSAQGGKHNSSECARSTLRAQCFWLYALAHGS